VAFSPAKAQSYGELEGRVGRVSREGRLLRERRRLTADRKGFEGFGSWSIAPCSSRRSWQQTKEGREGSSAPDWLTNSLKDEQEQSKAKQSDQPRDPLRDDCTAPHSTTEVKGANTICSQGGGATSPHTSCPWSPSRRSSSESILLPTDVKWAQNIPR
jgi:hypothetical protein